jgi:hypothetical protein
MAARAAIQQLSEALDQLEAFGVGRSPGERGLRQLPDRADDALMEHLARGLGSTARITGVGVESASRFLVEQTVRELRAAVALIQEWTVPE